MGDLGHLVKDIGIDRKDLGFTKAQDLEGIREASLTHPSDLQFVNLYNAIMTPIDMTDYEDEFGGENEKVDTYNNGDVSYMQENNREAYDPTHKWGEEAVPEPNRFVSKTIQEIILAQAQEEEEEEDEDEEEEGDDEEEGEGEEAEEEEEEEE
jgi:hypothetical protein